MKDLGNLGGSNGLLGPFLYGLNNRGQVTGVMNIAGNQSRHAFLWNGEKLADLGTLGGSYSFPSTINDAGDVVGGAWLPGDKAKHAVLWKKGNLTDLGTLHGDPCSFAESINAKGQIVGASQSALGGCDQFTAAFLWESGGPSVDLNSLVPSRSTLLLTGAFWINDLGEITGRGIPNGCDDVDTGGHAFLLIPCDQDHPGLEGCDYEPVHATTAAQITFPPSMAASQTTLTPIEIVTRFRSMIANHNRRFGVLRLE